MFKNYIQNQLPLIPQDYREYLWENHEAILLDTLMEELNFKPLYDSYANKYTWTSAYNPKMMTKVIVYAASKKYIQVER